MPFITPPNTPAYVCRGIYVPNSPRWKALVSGALLELARGYRWQQIDGIDENEAAEVGKQIAYSWMSGLCDSEVNAVTIEHVIVHATPRSDDNPQGVIQGVNQIEGWADEIQRDDTGEAFASDNALYLPAGLWSYDAEQYWDGVSGTQDWLPAQLYLEGFSDDPLYPYNDNTGVGSAHQRGGLHVSGAGMVIQGDAILLRLRSSILRLDPPPLGNHWDGWGTSLNARVHLWRAVANMPDEPSGPEYPIVFDFTGEQIPEHIILFGYGYHDPGVGLHGTPYEGNSDFTQVKIELTQPCQISRITVHYQTIDIPVTGPGINQIQIIGQYQSAEVFHEYIGGILTTEISSKEWLDTAEILENVYTYLRVRSASGTAWLTRIEIDGVGTPPY